MTSGHIGVPVQDLRVVAPSVDEDDLERRVRGRGVDRLDASTDDSVTLVEWGTGIAEGLAADRLEVDIRRSIDPSDETRWIFLTPIGDRWTASRPELEAL